MNGTTETRVTPDDTIDMSSFQPFAGPSQDFLETLDEILYKSFMTIINTVDTYQTIASISITSVGRPNSMQGDEHMIVSGDAVIEVQTTSQNIMNEDIHYTVTTTSTESVSVTLKNQ